MKHSVHNSCNKCRLDSVKTKLKKLFKFKMMTDHLAVLCRPTMLHVKWEESSKSARPLKRSAQNERDRIFPNKIFSFSIEISHFLNTDSLSWFPPRGKCSLSRCLLNDEENVGFFLFFCFEHIAMSTKTYNLQ